MHPGPAPETQVAPQVRVSVCLPAVPSCSEQVTVTVQWAQPLRVPQPGAQRLRGQHHTAPQQQQQHLHPRLLRAHPLRRAVCQGTSWAGRDCPTLATPAQGTLLPRVPQESGGCPAGAGGGGGVHIPAAQKFGATKSPGDPGGAWCPLSWAHVSVCPGHPAAVPQRTGGQPHGQLTPVP